MNLPTSVLLVEDDADLREVLLEILELSGFEVTAVDCALAFYRVMDQRRDFHVGIIDLGLPDQPGHVLADYARRNTRMSVIVVTANDNVDNRVDTYRAGADLFLGKPIDSRELVAAVSAMAERYRERHGNRVDASPVLSEGTAGWTLQRARRQLKAPGGQVIALNPQEVTVLEHLSGAAGQAVDRRMLLQAVYRRDDTSAQRALDNLMRRLRQKIGDATDQAAPILTAYGVGHSFSEPISTD